MRGMIIIRMKFITERIKFGNNPSNETKASRNLVEALLKKEIFPAFILTRPISLRLLQFFLEV
jgi:hypothetical protein